MESLTSMVMGCCLGTVLLAASVADLRARIVPNGCIVSGIAIWVAALLARWADGLPLSVLAGHVLWSLGGALGVSMLLLATSLAFERLAGKQGLGGGDIKLFFVTGLFLGFEGNVLNVLLACAFGAPFGWWWKRRARRAALAPSSSVLQASPIAVARDDGFPFAPCIALSTTICLLISV